ncbi:MAG: hypothetical protein V1809_01965 [Planctomycetota bacterium]
MAGNDLKKVFPGQRLSIPAGAYNAFIDAAEVHKKRLVGITGGENPFFAPMGILLVRNDSGGPRERFDVLGLDEIVISPEDNDREFKNHPILAGVVPDITKHRGRFGVLQEPVGSGMFARAMILGITPVKVAVPTGITCRRADITDGVSGHLTEWGNGSAEVLWHGGGTDEYEWAVVRLGTSPGVFPVKLVKTGGAAGDETVPASYTYDVRDMITDEMLLADVSPTLSPHQWKRPPVGRMIEATFGYAHLHENGFALGWINETVDQEACSSGEG